MVSRTRRHILQCPVTGEAFEADIWEIVDLEGGPAEAVERLRSGDAHIARSPASGEVEVDAPLLVYRKNDTPKVVFVPSRETSPEEDLTALNDLGQALSDALTAAGRLPDGDGLSVATISRLFLPLWVLADPEQRSFAGPIVAFLTARDGEQAIQVLSAHPELLTDAVQDALVQLSDARAPDGNQNGWRDFIMSRAQALQAASEQLTSAAGASTELLVLVQAMQATYQQAEASGDPQVLDRAYELARQVVSHADFDQAENDFKFQIFHLAGRIAMSIFAQTGGLTEKAEAERLFDLAMSTASSDIERADVLNSLSIGLQNRGERTQERTLFEEAIAISGRAIDLSAADRARQAGFIMTRANALQSLGDLAGGAEGVRALNEAVAGYDAALEVRTRESMPAVWAQTQNNRAAALQRLGALAGGAEGVRALNEAVAGYDAALEVRPRENMPAAWATTQNNRAAALSMLGDLAGGAEGVRALNDAVAGYDAALEVRTRESMPAAWATTQMNRANALLSLGDLAGGAEGVRALNDAVAGYDAALEVRTRESMPAAWAQTQMNRANALQRLGALAGGAEGVRALNDAVAGYDAALEVRTRESMPADWAATQMNRAAALSSLGDLAGGAEGVRALNDAVAGYDAALEVTPRESMPAAWAGTQNNRANALSSLGDLAGGAEGVRALNEAVAGYDAALEVMTRESMPADWAATQMNRANALSRLGALAGGAEGVRALNEAVAGYDAALEVMTRESMPADWAQTQMNRANTLSRLGDLAGGAEGVRALNEAVAGYDAALEVTPRESMPAAWAATQMNRANALKSLGDLAGGAEGVRALNEAVAGYDAALEVTPRESMPADWAATQMNRANALSSLGDLAGGAEGVRALNEAVAGYDAALEVRPRESMPADWATTQMNRANALSRLGDLAGGAEGVRALNEAVAGYDAALEVRPRESMPADWAATQMNRANALQRLGALAGGAEGVRALNEAVAGYDAALEVRPRESMPADWATTQMNRANALSRLGDLAGGAEGVRALNEAVAGYDAALEVRPRESMPAAWATTQMNRANALERIVARTEGAERRNAQTALETGLVETIEHLHEEVATEARPTRLAGQASNLTRRLAQVRMESDNVAGTLEAIELGRGVQVRAELTRDNAVPAGLSEADAERYSELVVQERQAKAKYRAFPLEAQDTPEAKGAFAEIVQLRNERRNLESKDPNFAPKTPLYGDIHAMAAKHDEAIVYLQPLNETFGTVAIVVHGAALETGPSPTETVILPDVSSTKISEWLWGTDETVQTVQDALDKKDISGISSDDLGWLIAYRVWIIVLSQPKLHSQLVYATALWLAVMSRTLSQVGEAVMAPLAERLEQLGIERVVLIPGDRLGFLPLHAAEIAPGIAFVDNFETRYAASATLLTQCHARQEKRTSQPTLTAVANPDRSLAFADAQVEKIAQLFPTDRCNVAHGTQASRTWLYDNVAPADILELSTHAKFSHDNSAQSYFTLAHPDGFYDARPYEARRAGGPETDYERLTLNDIQSGNLKLKQGALVVANACETGQFDLSNAALSEQLGFPTAFMAKGASTVLASFWAVMDFSTALLMERVYALMITKGQPPAHALRTASHWLRHLKKDEVIAWLQSEQASVAARQAELQQIAKDSWGAWETEQYESLSNRMAKIRSAIRHYSTPEINDTPFYHPYYWAPFAAYGSSPPAVSKPELHREIETEPATPDTTTVPSKKQRPWYWPFG